MNQEQAPQTAATQPELARFDCAALDGALAAFPRDGAITIGGFLPKDRVAQLHAELLQRYPAYVGAGEPGDSFAVGDRRFTAPLLIAPPFECQDIFTHPVVSELFPVLLGRTYVIEAFGVISSLPGAKAQAIHQDGGILFGETGIDKLLPPSAITAIIPLIDMDDVSVTTSLYLGSHRTSAPDPDGPNVAPRIPAGSLVIWDFRLWHNGLPNNGEVARPLLYITACRPFWIDHLNFRPEKNAKLLASRATLDGFDAETRKRFVRARAS